MPPPDLSHLDPRVATAVREILEEEDAHILAALDRAAWDRLAIVGTTVTERRDIEPIRDTTGAIVEMRPGQVYSVGEPHYIGPLPDRIVGRRVQVPEFELASNPRVILSDLQNRRYGSGGRTPKNFKARLLWLQFLKAKSQQEVAPPSGHWE